VIELKPAPGAEAETGRAAAELVERRWPKDKPLPVLSSFKPAALAAARAAAPALERALLVGAVPRDWQKQVEALGCGMLHADQRKLDRATAAAVRETGLPIFAYTVNLPERAKELFGWGVDAVFSDCPERVAAGLAAW